MTLSDASVRRLAIRLIRRVQCAASLRGRRSKNHRMIAVDYIILAIILISAVMGLVRGLLPRSHRGHHLVSRHRPRLDFRQLARAAAGRRAGRVPRCGSGPPASSSSSACSCWAARSQRGTWTLRSRLDVRRHGQVPGLRLRHRSRHRHRRRVHHRHPGTTHGRRSALEEFAAACRTRSAWPMRCAASSARSSNALEMKLRKTVRFHLRIRTECAASPESSGRAESINASMTR